MSPIDFHSMFFPKSMGYINCLITDILHNIILCSAEEYNSYRFETTWGWVHDYTIFIKLTIPLMKYKNKIYSYQYAIP